MDKRRFLNRSFLYVQKTVTTLLVFSFVFTDLASFLFHTPLYIVPRTHAATGDVSIYRETTGGTTINSSGTPLDVTWNTTVTSDTNIAIQGNSSDIDLADGGKYLVTYNAFSEEGGAGGSNRRSVNTYLTLAGAELPYGRGAGYMRDTESWNAGYAAGAAIIDAVAGDDLQVHIQRDDTNSGAGSEIMPNANGISVLKIPDNFDYLRAHRAATTTSIHSNTTFTDVSWDTSDEVDTDSFGFTPTSTDITLKGNDGDLFMVTTNVGLFADGGGTTRQNYEMMLTLGGTEVPGTRVTSYIRGTNDTWYGQLVYSGVIAKTADGDQTLNVEVRRESTSGVSTVIMGGKSGISIAAIPDTAEVIRLTDNSGTQTTLNSATALTFDTQEEISASAFSHSTTTNANRVEIDTAGDYLFFATAYSTTTSSGNNRQPFRMDWNLTGAAVDRGSFGALNRANATFSGGASGGLVFNSLTTSDYIALSHVDETSNTPVDATFSNGRVALQAIALNDNFFGLDTIVTATGTHSVTVNVQETEQEMGGAFVVTENTTSRFLNSLTVTETGSVDASTDLDNIELWYDLDTTSPYICDNQNYGTTSTQYGITDTNGFSGPDGQSSFTGSVSVSPTATFCGYILYDVTTTADDGDAIIITIDDPSTDLTFSGTPSVGPNTVVSPNASTTVKDSELTQVHYNWRHDDGSEVTATSIEGTEDTVAIGFANGTPRRLRLEVSNEGSIDSGETVTVLDSFSTGNTKTVSAGSERLLIVGIHSEDGNSINDVNINTVTYGGQTLTEIRDEQVATGAANGMWVGYLNESGIAAASGNSITPTWVGGTPDEAVLYSSVVLQGVDQTTPISGWSSNSSTSASNLQATSSVSVSAGEMSMFFSILGVSGQTHTAPSDYQEGTEQDSGGSGAVASNGFKTIMVDGLEHPTTTWTGSSRLAIVSLSVNGSTNLAASQQYRLEYAQKVTTCSIATGWTDVGAGGGDWDIADSVNLTEGNNTTNVTLQANGGVTDAALTFISPNNAVKDTSSQLDGVIIAQDEFLEMEFSIEPTLSAPEGNTYCFRVTDAGTEIKNYSVYPEGTVSADISVSASSSQTATLNVGSTNQYVGGTFVIERPGTTRTLTDITITETGTTDASSTLSNPTLYYETDTSAPFDCTGESYSGAESNVAGTNFSGANGTSSFNISGGIGLSSSVAFCGYIVLDVDSSAVNGDTINIEIADPSVDVVVTSSSVGPSTSVSPTGSTTIAGPIRTQTHYHWRNDNGSEVGATSATGGNEDTIVEAVPKESTRRLRLQVSNEGTVTTGATQYRLEYGTKVTSCSLVSWTDVGAAGGAFDMATSSNITDGNTTNITGTSTGEITDENSVFVGTGALRETSSLSGSITLSTTQFTELEYAIEATSDAGDGTTYCFRVTDSGSDLEAYTNYAELTTREKQDFFIQRGTETITGTSTILVAGVDYVAPSATSSAFVRITNSQLMGAGNNVGGNQNADDFTAYIEEQTDITTQFTIARPSTALSNTRVSWEIVEFVGIPGTDNEMIVRDTGTSEFTSATFNQSGSVVSSIVDDTDVVVFITGQRNNSAARTSVNDGLFISSWNATTSQPDFSRGDADTTAALSYAVVEYVGANWKIQRAEHSFSAAGSAETESITPVGSITQAFVHAQKSVGEGLSGLDELGHQVWLSSVGAVSFQLRSGAGTPVDHISVAWVVENTQSGAGKMAVYQSDGTIVSGGAEPQTNILEIGATIRTENASIFATNDSNGTGTSYPRVPNGVAIISTTQYEIWRSDTGQPNDYRVEIVEWPVAEISIRQNYYRFYVDNDTLNPTDPWPAGASDLGENTSITAVDDPLGEGERTRIRMSLLINNAALPASTKSFKLQFGRRITSCSAIAVWTDLGDAGSGSLWRGYDAAPADGDTLATTTLKISVSDIAGTYEEENNSAVNPYSADLTEEIEYDWLVEHNGAVQKSDYCFRMVESDGTELAGYNNYPTLRTTGYTPVIGNWRFYDDETSETPSSDLAAENVAPTDIVDDNIVKLRVTATEVEGAPGANLKFALQYSEYADFSDGGAFLTSTTSCLANSLWCYADGAGIDNQTISTTTLSDVDVCTLGVGDGCGTHNEAATTTSSLSQSSLSSMEMEFTLRHAGARANAVYYFRLYDITNDDPLVASSSFPSVVTEGASLSFSVSGLPSGTPTEGVTTDVSSSPSNIGFSSLPVDTEYEAAHRLTVNTNATQGYQMFVSADQGLINSYATPIDSVTGTNAVPTGWATGCLTTADGCFGYHAGDDFLLQGDSNRFGADDRYAALTTTPQEIMYSSIPTNESHDIVYKIQVTENQPAGDYETNISYIAVPVF